MRFYSKRGLFLWRNSKMRFGTHFVWNLRFLFLLLFFIKNMGSLDDKFEFFDQKLKLKTLWVIEENLKGSLGKE